MTSPLKVSIIICVYNGQRFLSRCLDSVLAQTLVEKEIILVNDGSTDQTLQIMQAYQALYKEGYPPITIIDQKNQGTGVARNNGVLAAKGDYIAFVDCDDYVLPNRYEKMVLCAEKYQADIVQSNARGIGMTYNKELFTGKKLKKADAVLKRYLNKREYYPMLWQQIQKRTLFDQDTFPTWHELHEDDHAFPQLLSNARTIYYLNESSYVYNITNTNGTMGKVYKLKGGRKKRRLSQIKACLALERHLKRTGKMHLYRWVFLKFKLVRFVQYGFNL